MQTKQADVVVIGSGPGGYVAAIRAASLGKSVVVVERDAIGGVCLNIGCIPTKALITTARHVEAARNAKKLGMRIDGDIAVDQGAATKRAKGVSTRMSKGVGHLLKSHSIEVVAGTGILEAPGTVQVHEGPRIEAAAVILATGARPRPLPTVAFDGRKVISSTEALKLEQVPGRLVVVGAGAIGMEFAYYYSVAGSEVTVIETMDSILPFADPEAVKAVARAMRRRRIKMLTSAKVTAAQVTDDVLGIDVQTDSATERLDADVMLVAIGVVPNTEGLWNPQLDLQTDGPFVRTDELCRTSVENVYAIGDLSGPPLLAHAASAEAIVAAQHICGTETHPKDPEASPGVVYCQPQVAQIGVTEKQAVDAGMTPKIGRYPFLASGMAQAAGESEGFVKLLFDESSERLIGATVVGAEAAELISELCLARENGLTATQIHSTIHPHPTYAEAVMEAAAQAAGEAIHC